MSGLCKNWGLAVGLNLKFNWTILILNYMLCLYNSLNIYVLVIFPLPYIRGGGAKVLGGASAPPTF